MRPLPSLATLDDGDNAGFSDVVVNLVHAAQLQCFLDAA
jgi:hypothetical protein